MKMEKVRKLPPTTTTTTPTKSNDGVLYTRNLILRSMCVVYLCAFLTFYYQSPGLFGKNGISPAHIELEKAGKVLSTAVHNKPTLLHFSSYLGLDTDYMMDVLSLLGASIAFLGFLFQSVCILPIFATLWTLYYSLVQVTQTFSNQSDYLLLEAGFLCLILAPVLSTKTSGVADKIGMIMLKWLVFRFMFDSGSVKFLSGCSYWWSFTGLSRHFETLPLPTSFGWYLTHLPVGFWKIGTIYTNISELICPWFFFFPSRAVRTLLFYWELYLQLNIIITGNYGFLNFLMIALLFALLDDKYFLKSKTSQIIHTFLSIVIFSALTYGIYWYYQDNLDAVAFKQEHLGIIRSMIKLSPLVPLVAVIATFLTNIYSHPSVTNSTRSFWRKASDINTLLAFTLCSLALIGISVVPHNNIDAATNITNTQLGKYYQDISKYKIVNQYGQHLRKMRPDRLEVNLEYSQRLDGPWQELPFVYKPWNIEKSLPYAGPYLPRLDMKFYELPVSNYRDQTWVLSMGYRILQNEPTVLKLLGITEPLKPTPKYIRAIRNKFKYTPVEKKNEPAYWKTKGMGEYFPEYTIDDPNFIAHLKSLKIISNEKLSDDGISNTTLKFILDFIRKQFWILEAHILIIGILIAGFAIIFTKK